MKGRIKALLLLALALLRTLWRRFTGPPVDGLARFRTNYAEDGLSPVSEWERAEMASFGRCIACGRCDRGDAERATRGAGHFRGTMSLVLAASRSMPDYRAAALAFSRLSERELAEKEALCPTGVPFRRIAQFVSAHAADARVSLPAARGAKRLPSSFPPRGAVE
jgi:hypothetical protein